MIAVQDPHTLFSIVERHLTQHLSNVKITQDLSKVLGVDSNSKVSMSLHTKSTQDQTYFAHLLIVKCEHKEEYKKSVRNIIKTWLNHIGTKVGWVVLCLTGFSNTNKSTTFYAKMRKEFRINVAGDATSLVNARALSQQTCTADLSDVISKLIRSSSKRCVEMYKHYDEILKSIDSDEPTDFLEIRESRAQFFESLSMLSSAYNEFEMLSGRVTNNPKYVPSEFQITDANIITTLSTLKENSISKQRLDIYLFLLRRRILVKDYERCCSDRAFPSASLHAAQLARICHSLLRRVVLRKSSWFVSMVNSHVGFFETCYSCTPSKALACQIGYFCIFAADYMDKKEQFLSLATKMFEEAKMNRMKDFVNFSRGIVVTTKKQEWASLEQSLLLRCNNDSSESTTNNNNNNDGETGTSSNEEINLSSLVNQDVVVRVSNLEIVKNMTFLQCRFESNKTYRANCIHLVSKSLNLMLSPIGDDDEMEIPGLVSFRLEVHSLPKDLHLEMNVLGLNVCLPIVSSGMMMTVPQQELVKSIQVNCDAAKEEECKRCCFQGTVVLRENTKKSDNKYFYQVHYDVKYWLPPSGSSSRLRSELIFESMVSKFHFKMIPVNPILSVWNLPRVSILLLQRRRKVINTTTTTTTTTFTKNHTCSCSREETEVVDVVEVGGAPCIMYM